MRGLQLDHATIRTSKLKETVAFYSDYLGFSPGWRPTLPIGGVWLYAEGGDYPILHVIEVDKDLGRGGMFDHIAFKGAGLSVYLQKLRATRQAFQAMPVPETPYTQVHHYDPNGVKIEVTFEEHAPPEALHCDMPFKAS